MNEKVCRFFMSGNCKKGNDCNFVHDSKICRDWYKGRCNRKDCRFKHVGNQQLRKKRVKNTTDFNPSHVSPDIRIIPHVKQDKYTNNVSVNDVIVIPNFIDNSYYDKLVKEMEEVKKQYPNVWKLWHGDSHFIADDKLGWKSMCPIFNDVIEQIKKYFSMDVKATRFNMYHNDSEWKPYHHDAAAVKKDKAKTQNFTVGLSLGNTREASFQHAKYKTTVNIPLVGGSIYTFSRDVNIEWKHGIPQVPVKEQTDKGRLSIILWGYIDEIDGTRSEEVLKN